MSYGRVMTAEALLQLLTSRGETLATAESLTGGRLAARITGVPGASLVYVGGVVSYATDVKRSLLGVPDSVVATYGVVSPECARAMAAGVRDLLGATWALATTGVAGPDPQEGRPPGTVHLAVAGPAVVTARSLYLAGDRATVQERTCDEVLSTLAGMLQDPEPRLG